jgi:hypothetical protein
LLVEPVLHPATAVASAPVMNRRRLTDIIVSFARFTP